MSIPADMRERFDNITFNIDTPEGKANIIIVEDSPGKIYKIFYTIGKAGSVTNAWAHALSEMVVTLLDSGKQLADVLALLSNITSSRSIYSNSGIACRSGPEALYLALMRYRSIYSAQEKLKNLPDNYRPPKIGKVRG